MFDLTKLQLVDSSDSCLVRLKIDQADQDAAWYQAQDHSNPISRYNAYLNGVCLKTFMQWITELLAEEGLPQPSVWKHQVLASIWEFVNGTAIEIGDTRLVLIPSDEGDLEEFCVPQEWVDMPHWTADYYLPVQMNLNGDDGESWMEVLGFATHRQLKHEGKYNMRDRTYALSTQELTKSLLVMDITLGLNLQQEVPPLPSLSEVESTELLHTLGNSSVYSPRLLVPFAQWASFLTNDGCRQKLYNQRLGIIEEPVLVAAPSVVIKSGTGLVERLKTYIQAGWEMADKMMEKLEIVEPGFIYAVEGGSYRDGGSSNHKGIPTLIDLLRDRNQGNQWRAAEFLGRFEPGNQEAISALAQLLQTTQDDILKRQAAVSLGKLDPNNSAAGVRIGKMIELKMELDSDRVVLEITLLPEGSDKTNIFLRVLPVRSKTLPPNLELIILDEDSEVFWEEQAHNFTNSLMYEFQGAIGDCFQVKIACGEVSITENFTI
ncbi:DUF1822 family protein [Tychonema sp. BBK16]|uniref:DUF1822 family protein n=1 Tax=Tychonema sp. BBK16 TaxID=2699888 RepID=UPI001F42C862|nr:DUF1822 family protein [Tychonema sp. BBK16]MCF6372195.1 DUF1822 family protein [Tychonema sp. BBK16]